MSSGSGVGEAVLRLPRSPSALVGEVFSQGQAEASFGTINSLPLLPSPLVGVAVHPEVILRGTGDEGG